MNTERKLTGRELETKRLMEAREEREELRKQMIEDQEFKWGEQRQ